MISGRALALFCLCVAETMAAVEPGGYWQATEAVLTAYDPCKACCGRRAVGLTATGVDTRSRPYGIAADSDALPYGIIVWIPAGLGYLDRSRPDDEGRQFPVDDTGGILRRRTRATGVLHLDLRFIHHGNAVRFGIKTATVYVWHPAQEAQ